MVLLFKFDANDPLEHIFASGRYQRYWQANGEYIVASLHRHTGLRFIQRKITVKIKEGSVSQAGNENKPMRLSVENKTDSELACTLIHELAHRLVMGNGIVPSDKNEHAKSRAPYHMHRHIYLFLYDVLVDIVGEEVAAQEVASESGPRNFYRQAWAWAMSKNYTERQAAFARLKFRHMSQ